MENRPLVRADRHGRNWVPRRLAQWTATTAAVPAPSRRERPVRPSLISYAAWHGGAWREGRCLMPGGEGGAEHGAPSQGPCDVCRSGQCAVRGGAAPRATRMATRRRDQCDWGGSQRRGGRTVHHVMWTPTLLS
jgi:hypothetical protein